ncbi:uncharacterized protein LOC130762864 [Actinidia eriantha]|uniref:uncharacterized protein LOC130762864 n=1 Tax=Actinidia eriantha TaxID=165200 RepID=UPI00258E526F|nr:uncharacterized protein LOC130762864 [Actinidia eriantha]
MQMHPLLGFVWINDLWTWAEPCKTEWAPSTYSLLQKILALLADVLIEIQEQVMGGDEEDSEWEEAEAGDAEDHDLLYSVDATSYSRPSYEHLDAMAKVLNEDQDGDEDGLLIGADPLNEINLANYLFDFLVKFAQTDRPLFDHLCQVYLNLFLALWSISSIGMWFYFDCVSIA